MDVVKKTVAGIPVTLVSRPGSSNKTAVVMIQEWWGITEQLIEHAKYASEKLGATIAVPDMYNGKSTLEAKEAHHLMDNLDWPKAVEQLGAVGNFLKEEGHESVGIMGFCMGGALTVAASTNVGSPPFVCGVAFYGTPPLELADPTNCKIPMMGHFGERDNLEGFSDPETAKKLEKSWEKAGIEHELIIHPKVGHAFMNDTKSAVEKKKELKQIGDGDQDAKHDPEVIKVAWEKTFTFFKSHNI